MTPGAGRILALGSARDPAHVLRRPGRREGRALVMEWWVWPIALFAVTFAIRIVSVRATGRGGTAFFPIDRALFPFPPDICRPAGLLPRPTRATSCATRPAPSGLP